MKAEGTMWAQGELAFGVICSSLFILARLYRHVTAVSIYNSRQRNQHRPSGSPTNPSLPPPAVSKDRNAEQEDLDWPISRKEKWQDQAVDEKPLPDAPHQSTSFVQESDSRVSFEKKWRNMYKTYRKNSVQELKL